MNKARRVDLTLWVALFAAIALSPATLAAGDCFTANVASTIVLPDRSVHVARTMRICLRTISPSQALNTIYVDGHPVGMFQSRTGFSEGRPEGTHALLVFALNSRSQLELQGVAVPDGKRYETHTLATSPGWLRALGPRPDANLAEGYVEIAANR